MSRDAIEEILSRAMEDEHLDLRQVLRALGPNEGETKTSG